VIHDIVEKQLEAAFEGIKKTLDELYQKNLLFGKYQKDFLSNIRGESNFGEIFFLIIFFFIIKKKYRKIFGKLRLCTRMCF
jgi:hypothetical protein